MEDAARLLQLVVNGAAAGCIYGLIALSQGALLVSMIWAAAIAYMLDRKFLHAAGWLFAGSLLSCFGFIHGYSLTAQGIENKIGWFVAPAFTLSYLAAGIFLVGSHFYSQRYGSFLESL